MRWSGRSSESRIIAGQFGGLVEAKPISFDMTRDGLPVIEPISQMLAGTIVRYHLDEEGQIRKITGFQGLVERATASMQPEMAEALATMLSEEALVARERAEWDSRVSGFVGLSLVPGEALIGEATSEPPNGGTVVYQTRLWLVGFEPCPAGRCARLEMRFDSDAAALGELLTEVADEQAEALESDTTIGASGTRIEGEASRLIDPATMFLYDESSRRTIRMTLTVPGLGTAPMIIKEEHNYTYSYEE